MKVIAWSGVYKKYKGLWVALKDDEETVISSGKTLDETANKAKKKGFDNPIFMKVPKRNVYLIGSLI